MITEPIQDAYDIVIDSGVLPEHLYHYTSMDALEPILRSRSFRATYRYSLNDSRDLTYGINLCIEVAQKWTCRQTGSLQLVGREVVQKLQKEAAGYPTSAFSYSASFTDQVDGERHWKEYANDGIGVCICLNVDRFWAGHQRLWRGKNPLDWLAAHFFIYKVEYDEKQQRNAIMSILNSVAKCWPEAKAKQCSEEFVARPASFSLTHVSGYRYKDQSYGWEKEWKATPNVSGQEKIVTGIEGKRFIKMVFDPSCIDSVMLGPAYSLSKKNEVREILLENGLANVRIKESSIKLAHKD